MNTDKAKAKDKNKGGRPTLMEPARIEKLLSFIRSAIPLEPSCHAARLSYATLRSWLIKGEEAEEKGDKDSEFFKFLEVYRRADAEAEATLVLKLQVHGQKTWQALAFIAERRWTHRWGRRWLYEEPPPETTPDDDDAIEIEVVAPTTEPEGKAVGMTPSVSDNKNHAHAKGCPPEASVHGQSFLEAANALVKSVEQKPASKPVPAPTKAKAARLQTKKAAKPDSAPKVMEKKTVAEKPVSIAADTKPSGPDLSGWYCVDGFWYQRK